MEIVKVKDNGQGGYLVNDTTFVPNAEDNRHYKMVQGWIAGGGVVEPAHTPEELEAIKRSEEVAEAKAYLKETDWYIIRKADTGKAVPDKVEKARAKARLKADS